NKTHRARVFSQLNLKGMLSLTVTLGTHGNPQLAKRIVNIKERAPGSECIPCARPILLVRVVAKSKRAALGGCPSIVKKVSRIAFHKLVFLISIPRPPTSMDPHHSALPSDLAFWSYAPPQTEDLTIGSDIAGHAQPVSQSDLSYSFTVNTISSEDTTGCSRLALTGSQLELCRYAPKPGPGWRHSC
ncbi:hypothetical protein BC827DRAFT_1238465, partial [Russula dissimulans]